jgi:hypothetical protein
LDSRYFIINKSSNVFSNRLDRIDVLAFLNSGNNAGQSNATEALIAGIANGTNNTSVTIDENPTIVAIGSTAGVLNNEVMLSKIDPVSDSKAFKANLASDTIVSDTINTSNTTGAILHSSDMPSPSVIATGTGNGLAVAIGKAKLNQTIDGIMTVAHKTGQNANSGDDQNL